MVKTNEKQDALKQAAASLTVKLANMLRGRGKAQSVYRLLDENIRATITEGTFSKMVERVQKTPKEKLGDLKDPNALTIKISRSQIMVHNILSCLNKDEDEFFKESFEAPDKTVGNEENSFHELSLHLDALESKLDYVTDCVDSEQRKSIPERFSELMSFVDAQESALTRCMETLENDENVTNDCMFAYFCSIMSYVARLRRGNKIMVRLEKILKSTKNQENTTLLLVYIATGLLIFLKLVHEFVDAYEHRRRKKVEMDSFRRCAFLVETGECDERRNYEDEPLNKNAENKIMDELKDLEILLFQVLDAERICETAITEADCKEICRHAQEIFINGRDMFFNQKIIEPEKKKYSLKLLVPRAALLDTGSDIALYRLFLTNKRRKAVKDMSSWMDSFFDEHEEV